MDGEITIGELDRTMHRVEQKLDNHNEERKLDNQDHEDRLRRIEKWMYGVGAVSDGTNWVGIVGGA